ncbi:MAG TPA: ATP-binding protein, partial [Deltaproteobacteria bacterium]|nr:ATP-binding protein [Deltaproteobacteria bacterium]
AIECVRDISDEKRSREVLKRLGQTVEQLLDGVLITDLEGKITYMNPSWAAMHRCVPEDGIGGHVGVFHTEDQMVSEVGPFLADVMSKGSARATVGHVTKDDEVFRTLSTAFVLKDDQARSTAIIWICRDITEELRLEEQLRQAQKMEVVGRLAGGVAHDLNNMLSPILGYAEIALAELDEGSPLYDDITQIRHAAERARNLTHELLAFSRKQVLDMKVTDLGDVVSGYAKMLRRTIREDISISINRNLCTKAVKVDVGRMGQILMNLAVNAQDAMPHGGVVTIETSQVTLDETYAHTHEGVRPGEYLVLGFSDTGTGIDRKVKEHIFEPFFTTKDTGKGTGLGLATVYGIVRQHGGHISVYSEPGMGTTFRIYLPAVNHAENGTSDSAEPAPVAVGKETIAVAEDDPHVRALACEILRKHGYSVVTAEKSDELVEKLQGCI